MPQYLSPGVYVEEVEAGPKPIEGVSTSIAGAVGVTARGPDTGKPVLITSFTEYTRVFGGGVVVDESIKSRWSNDPEKGEFWTFPHAIKGFFDNGGEQIFVRRVVASGATAADTSLGQGLATMIAADTAEQAKVIKVESVIGISKDTEVQIWVGGALTAKNKVVDVDPTARLVTLTSSIAPRLKAGVNFVQITTTTGTAMKVKAKSVGTWGKYLSVRCVPMEAASLALLADPALAVAGNPNEPAATQIATDATDVDAFDVLDGTKLFKDDRIIVDGATYKVTNKAGNTLTVEPVATLRWTAGAQVRKQGSDADGAKIKADAQGNVIELDDVKKVNKPPADPALGDIVTAGNGKYRVTNVDAANNKLALAPVRTWSKGVSVLRVRYAASQIGATPELYVWGVASLYKDALVQIEDTVNGRKYYGTVASVDGNKIKLAINWPVSAAPPPPFAAFDMWEGERLKLIEAQFDVQYTPPDGPPREEQIGNVRLSGDDNDLMHVKHRLSAASGLIDLVEPPAVNVTSIDKFPLAVDNPSGAPPTAQAWAKLASGDDALGTLDPDAFVGKDGGPGKRTGIQALEDIDDISICVVPSIWSSLVQNALIQHCEMLKYRFAILDPRPVNPASVDAIGDIRAFREGFDTKYAALYFPRIEVRDPFAPRTVGVGPSGHMAGLYARVDNERGVHKAPANEVIRGIDTANGFHGLEDEITKREQDLLNPRGINALRFFPNRGTRVWGARTLSSDGQWKYINVRRIFIYVERSIDVGTQWVVFEPNDEKTWARVRQTITNFLTTVWRSGALFGTKAEEAFFVRCDRTTMSQDDIDNGRLIVVIGICPVKPAEFVIFRIQQKLIDQKQS